MVEDYKTLRFRFGSWDDLSCLPALFENPRNKKEQSIWWDTNPCEPSQDPPWRITWQNLLILFWKERLCLWKGLLVSTKQWCVTLWSYVSLGIPSTHVHLSSHASFFSRFFFCFLKITHTYCLLILGGLSFSKACARMWNRDCVFRKTKEWMFEMRMADREEGLKAGDHPLQHGDDCRALLGPGWALHAELLVRALLLVEKIGAKDGGQVQGRHLISCDLFGVFLFFCF